MSKWLLLAVVLALAFWWVTRARGGDRGPKGGQREAKGGEPGPKAGPPPPQPMVACAHCGLRLPQAEALVDEATGRAYCSAEHRQAGPTP